MVKSSQPNVLRGSCDSNCRFNIIVGKFAQDSWLLLRKWIRSISTGESALLSCLFANHRTILSLFLFYLQPGCGIADYFLWIIAGLHQFKLWTYMFSCKGRLVYVLIQNVLVVDCICYFSALWFSDVANASLYFRAIRADPWCAR